MDDNRIIAAVFCNDLIPEEIIDELSAIAKESLIDLPVVRKKNEPMAGMEWFLPTAMALHFIKPYPNAFLSEMGKDNYISIKKLIITAARKLVGRDKIINIKVITSTSSPKKTDRVYSIAFSALAKISEKDKVKFLFDDSLTQTELEDYAIKIENFLLKNSTDDIMEIIKRNGELHIMNTSLYAYDHKTKELIVLDPLPIRGRKEC